MNIPQIQSEYVSRMYIYTHNIQIDGKYRVKIIQV